MRSRKTARQGIRRNGIGKESFLLVTGCHQALYPSQKVRFEIFRFSVCPIQVLIWDDCCSEHAVLHIFWKTFNSSGYICSQNSRYTIESYVRYRDLLASKLMHMHATSASSVY